jgi:hypothetical protein
MKNWKILTGLLLVVGLAVQPLRSQEMSKKEETVKPLPGPSKLVLGQWNEIAGKLITMAEDFPEVKYDFKPTPAQRTFAEQLLHAAGTTYYFTNLANGQKPPAEEDPKRTDFQSKAEIVAFVRKCFSDGAAAIQSRGDKGMGDWVEDPGSKHKMQLAALAYGFAEHLGEHYGQLVVYYRLNGLVPPESRPKK